MKNFDWAAEIVDGFFGMLYLSVGLYLLDAFTWPHYFAGACLGGFIHASSRR